MGRCFAASADSSCLIAGSDNEEAQANRDGVDQRANGRVSQRAGQLAEGWQAGDVRFALPRGHVPTRSSR